MIDKGQLRELITEVLVELGAYRPSAVELLMMTAAVESKMGTYLYQIRGPARGIFQMEPATEKDIWDNYLKYNKRLAELVSGFMFSGKSNLNLTANIPYQIAMARVHYLRVPHGLPSADDVSALAKYWKDYYNTRLGKGTVEKAIEAYRRYAM